MARIAGQPVFLDRREPCVLEDHAHGQLVLAGVERLAVDEVHPLLALPAAALRLGPLHIRVDHGHLPVPLSSTSGRSSDPTRQTLKLLTYTRVNDPISLCQLW